MLYRLLRRCLPGLLLAACMLPVLADERPKGFVDVTDVVADITLDIRYYGTHNFVGERIDGYEAPRCLLTRPAAESLARVARDAAGHGLGLKLFDCYRPQRAVAHFVRWARDLDDTRNKDEFYPDVDKSALFEQGYIAERSGHSRGSTVDLTLVRLEDGAELDMGTPYDYFGKASWPSDTSVTEVQRLNRQMLAELMLRHGFEPLQEEWWHFTLGDEPYPDTYFDFPVR